MRIEKLNRGDRVRVRGLLRTKNTQATVLYRYPRPEERHLVCIQRDGISRREVFNEKCLAKLSK